MSDPYESPRPPEPEYARGESTPSPDASPAGYPSVPQRPAPFYTPPPGSEQPTCTCKSRSRWGLVGAGLLTAVVLGWGGWYAIHTIPASGPVAPTVAEAAIQKTFTISNADMDAKATDALKALLAGGSSASGSALSGLNAANAEALKALAQNSPQFAEEVKSGQRALYRLRLLDSLIQDNDEVELFAEGISCGRVPLSNAGTEILIPVAKDAPMQMKVLATRDGGGGVTLGLISSLGEARTSIMQVGDFEQWQIMLK